MIKTFKRIIKPFLIKFIILSIIIIISNTSIILVPYYNGKFIDSLVTLESIDNIKKYAFLVIAFSLLNAITAISSEYIQLTLSEQIKFINKFNIIDKLRKIPFLKFKEFDPVYLYQRIEQDSATIVDFVLQNIVLIFIYGVKLIVVFYILLKINVYIAGFVGILMPIYLFVYSKFREPLRNKSFIVRETQNEYYKDMNQQLEYMYVIKLNAKYNDENTFLRKSFNRFIGVYKEYARMLMIFNFSQGGISFIFQTLTLVLGGYYVINKDMTIGELAVIGNYYGIIESIIKYYYTLGKDYQNFIVANKRNSELLKISNDEIGNIKINVITHLSANLTYKYNEKKIVLDKKEIELSLGDILLIRGENGKGKTTIIQLINGILRGKDVDIRYNDIDIDKINLEYMREKAISNVPQDITIKNISVLEFLEVNMENMNNDFDNIKKKLLYRGSDEDRYMIDFLLENLHKSISELSGGDKQFLYILKELSQDKSMLVLDEPSSNLDYIRIEWLKKYINNVRDKKIIIIITHDDRLNFSNSKILNLD